VELHIELKVGADGLPYPGLEARIAEHVRRRGLVEQAVLTSFWPEVLHRLRAAFPEGKLLASVNGFSAEKLGGLDAALDELDAVKVDYVAVHHALLDQEMEHLQRRVGADRLCAWVINDPVQITRWIKAPVAYITTDRPDLFPRQGRS
jgi:glycerophosphoryl diester phosphodiesterase